MIATMIGSGGESSKPRGPPTTTFCAFDNGSKIRAASSSGAELASFTVEGNKSSFAIIRQMPGNPAPVQICTGEKSSMSSSTTMTVHGQQITYKPLSDWHLEMPQGRFRWKSDSMSEKRKELIDSNKQVVAFADLEAMKLDVLVNADEMFLDCVLAAFVALMKRKAQDGKEAKAALTGFKIIGALAGGGGA